MPAPQTIRENAGLMTIAAGGNLVQNFQGALPNLGYPQANRNWPGYLWQGWSQQTAWAPSSNIAQYGLSQWNLRKNGSMGLGGLGTITATVEALPTWQKVAGVVAGLWVLSKLVK